MLEPHHMFIYLNLLSLVQVWAMGLTCLPMGLYLCLLMCRYGMGLCVCLSTCGFEATPKGRVYESMISQGCMRA